MIGSPDAISANGQRVTSNSYEIDGVSVNGVDIITWNADGKITDFKVMVRPLKALNLIHQPLDLGRRRGRHQRHQDDHRECEDPA